MLKSTDGQNQTHKHGFQIGPLLCLFSSSQLSFNRRLMLFLGDFNNISLVLLQNKFKIGKKNYNST